MDSSASCAGGIEEKFAQSLEEGIVDGSCTAPCCASGVKPQSTPSARSLCDLVLGVPGITIDGVHVDPSELLPRLGDSTCEEDIPGEFL